MKLSDQHIFKGYWWLPEKEEDKVAGILTYNPEEKILLELIGGFSGTEGKILGLFECDPQKEPLIYGIDSEAEAITLIDCHSCFSYNFSSSFPMMRYSTRMVIIGKHIKSIDECCNYTANVRFPELSHWAPPEVIQQTCHFNSAGELESSSFQIPNCSGDNGIICSVSLENGFLLSINKGALYHSETLMLKPSLEQFSYLKLRRPSGGTNIQELLHTIYDFQQFLSLATRRTVRAESIYLQDPDIRQDINDAKSFCLPIHILTRQAPAFNPEKLNRINFIFNFEDFPDRIPELIRNWMSESGSLQPIKHHLVDSLSYKPVVGSTDFLIVIQAIEGVWWRFLNDDYCKTHNLKRNKNTCLQTIISEMTASLSDIPDIKRLNIDIDATVHSRHYYSHFMYKSKKPKTLTGISLYNLTIKLRTVLLCHVLERLGLTHEEISSIISQQTKRHCFE